MPHDDLNGCALTGGHFTIRDVCCCHPVVLQKLESREGCFHSLQKFDQAFHFQGFLFIHLPDQIVQGFPLRATFTAIQNYLFGSPVPIRACVQGCSMLAAMRDHETLTEGLMSWAEVLSPPVVALVRLTQTESKDHSCH